ncbi:ATP-binding protein [Bacillus salacetis]|uniref:ATP-binding protein n=1 Tax=Bacillus salacetis TaxID=2315464 RepID=UPI003BA1AC77
MTNHVDFSHLIDDSRDAQVVMKSGNILYTNQAFIDLLGFQEAKEILGRDISGLIHPSSQKEGLVHDLRAMCGKIVPFNEQKLISADGSILDVEIMGAPFLHVREVLVLAIIRDLSAAKKSEELLRQSEKLSLIGELASGIVHEIRNPLTAMKGFLQLMKSHPKPEYLDIVMRELKQIEEIANELLHFSKPAEQHLTRQNILAIVKEAVNFSGAESFKRNVKVEFYHGDECDIGIIGNKTQLKQVLLNLIKNGLEAITTDGKIKVHISKDDHQVYIHISDNGGGIPKDQLDKIGKSFYTSKEQGTGLGLMVSFNIIKSHNGSIDVESEENLGTTFKITLPLANEEALPLLP